MYGNTNRYGGLVTFKSRNSSGVVAFPSGVLLIHVYLNLDSKLLKFPFSAPSMKLPVKVIRFCFTCPCCKNIPTEDVSRLV